MTSEQKALQQLQALGYTIVDNNNGNLHIAYHKDDLFTVPVKDGIQEVLQHANLSSDYYVAPPHQISIAQLKTEYPSHDPSINDGSNMTNQHAHQIIDTLENILNQLLTKTALRQLFDFLPYTKSGKFSKSKHITLYSTMITNTINQDYFAQTQIALQLQPVTMWNKTNPFQEERLNTIAILTINPHAKPTKKTEDIIDDNGNFHQLSAKQPCKYLTPNSLIPGTSYIDNKGNEYLYLGNLSIKYIIHFAHSGKSKTQTPTGPYYQRITKKIQDEIAKTTTVLDFLKLHFSNTSGEVLTSGMNCSISKRFVSKGNTYFQQPHNTFQQSNILITNKNGHNFDINIEQN